MMNMTDPYWDRRERRERRFRIAVRTAILLVGCLGAVFLYFVGA